MLRMRLRRLPFSSVFLGGALICVIIVFIYQIYNLPTPPDGDNIWDSQAIEARMKRLEQEIHANQLTVEEIKSKLRLIGSKNRVDLESLIKDTAVGHEDFKKSFTHNSHVVMNLTTGFTTGCLDDRQSASTVDYEMNSVFDKLKLDNYDGGEWKQGWKIEYDVSQWSSSKKLKVIVVPHSHNDPGWLKTFERYYEEQTRSILDNLVEKLSVDKRRKFIWAEISYLSLWWDSQGPEVRRKFAKLVENGQLEIVTGGWVMNDEANTHFYAMLEQMVAGHEWLAINLNVKPNCGWAIDPFGMSPTMAYLLKRMGMENMLIQRVHYSVKKHLAQEKSLEFRWRQAWDGKNSTDIFCHLMPFYSYDVPHTCGPDPKICCQFDFHRLPGSGVTCPWRIPPQPINAHNVESRAQLLLDQYRKKSQLYRTNVVLIPLGDDFRYFFPAEWDNQFSNYQLLFDHMNSRVGWNVQAQFGTLADYFQAVKEESSSLSGSPEGLFPIVTGDFFTYADRDDHYWSGYYTSRPFYKNMDRVLEGYLRGAEIIFSLTLATQAKYGAGIATLPSAALMDSLSLARRNLALFQHHDGITGTSKDAVVADYATKLFESIHNCQHVIQQSTYYLLSDDKKAYHEEPKDIFYQMGEKYVTINHPMTRPALSIKEGTDQRVVFYNTNEQIRTELVTVRTSSPYIQIFDAKNLPIACQVDPVFIKEGVASDASFDVSFLISVPAISLSTYLVRGFKADNINKGYVTYGRIFTRDVRSPSAPAVFQFTQSMKSAELFSIAGLNLEASFSADGLLESVESQGHTQAVNLHFVKYGVRNTQETSGAYLFLPDGDAVTIPTNNAPVVTVKGPLISSVFVHLNHILHTVIVKNSKGVDGASLHIANYVDISRERNFELAMRFETKVKNGQVFYTDLNGLQLAKRIWRKKLPLQANFYPVASQIFIEDDSARVTLLSAQPLGGASLKEGQFEIMLDRRLAQDDNRGLQQGVLDNLVTPNNFRLLVELRKEPKRLSPETTTTFPSLLSEASLAGLLYPLYSLFPLLQTSPTQPYWSVGGSFPCDVQLVNLRTMLNASLHGLTYFPTGHIPSPFTALTLRRLGVDCSFTPLESEATCSTGVGGTVHIRDMFPALYSDTLHQLSLSLMYPGTRVTKTENITLQPMELYAFQLRYR